VELRALVPESLAGLVVQALMLSSMHAVHQLLCIDAVILFCYLPVHVPLNRHMTQLTLQCIIRHLP